jgi:hypothetical protein
MQDESDIVMYQIDLSEMPTQEPSTFTTNSQFTDWIADLKTKIHVAKNKMV